MPMQIDSSTEFGQRVEQRLQDERIIWLTTVRPAGQPISIPIWFVWDGETVLMYSQRDRPKLRNIAGNSKVSLNLNSDETGGNVIQIDGDAVIDEDVPPAHEMPALIEKYGANLARMGMTPESFAAEYAVPIRVTPRKLRGH